MYLLFRYKNMFPHEYKKLSRGEKKVMKYFMYQEIEDRDEEFKAMNERGLSCGW